MITFVLAETAHGSGDAQALAVDIDTNGFLMRWSIGVRMRGVSAKLTAQKLLSGNLDIHATPSL